MWKIALCFTSCLYLDSITNNDASKINQPLIFSHIRASPSSYHERTENTTRMNVKVKEWFACIGMESVTFDKLIAKSWMYCKQNSVLSSRPCWRSLTHTSILTQQRVTEKHTGMCDRNPSRLTEHAYSTHYFGKHMQLLRTWYDT